MGASVPPEIDQLLQEQMPDAFNGDGTLVQEHERSLLPSELQHSTDVEERQPETITSQGTALTVQDRADMGIADTKKDPDAEKAMQALYGTSFPLLETNPDDGSWVSWTKDLWGSLKSSVEPRAHLVERNRLMRRGVQWISSQGMGPWREPPKPRDSTRAVDNVIAPALDQRLQIISEQRPGFRTRPESQDQKAMKKAEAQQVALEYQYHQQDMAKIIREGGYWAGTDGVAFLHGFWNPERGPWDEVLMFDEQGQPKSQQGPLGDMETQVLRFDEVRVSPEATATKKPTFWIVRKVIPTQQAVAEYGTAVISTDSLRENGLQTDSLLGSRTGLVSTLPDQLFRDMPTVDCFYVYCERSSVLQHGLMMKIIGEHICAGPMPLLYGRVPIIRMTDGSTDPNFFCQAIMEDWIDSQMRINVLKSKWIDSIRVNAGGRFLAKENTLGTETLIGGMTSYISVKGPGAVSDSVHPVQGFSVGEDVKELLEIERKAFEDRSGWNDTSRGSFSEDQSGRAILAIREQLERAFAPPVNAVADAMTEWAKLAIDVMKWGYDYPRTLSVQGSGRPDLARAISSEDLDGVVNVSIDPETLMPMPRALRLFLLDSLLQKGAIGMDEYKRRMPFAFTNNLDSPDNDQFARAQRVVQSIRESGNPNALPLLWQDDEAIHQDAIERELILPDELPINHPVRQAALARWQMLAQQAAKKAAPPQPNPGPDANFEQFVTDVSSKALQAAAQFVAKEVSMEMGTAPPPPNLQGGEPGQAGSGPPKTAGAPAHHGKEPTLPPGVQPMQGTNPGLAAAGTSNEQASNDQGAAKYEGATP